MKTITSFIITVVLLLLSFTVLYFAVNTFINAFTVCYNNTTGELQDLTVPFLVYGFLQLCVSLFIFLNAIKTFKLFLTFYSKYQHKKRDTMIRKAVEESKYNELLKNMQNTNKPESLDTLVSDFYKFNSPKSKQDDLDRFITQLFGNR